MRSEGTPLDVRVAPANPPFSLVTALTEMVNNAYVLAEAGMWHPNTPRTNADEMVELIRTGELLLAHRDGVAVGCVRVRRTEDGAGEFAMLAVDSSQRGTGVGRDLVAATEAQCAAIGCPVMRLELLVPRHRERPSKVFLRNWYTRIGYVQVRLGCIEDDHPELAPWLAEPCDYLVYEKPLGRSQTSTAGHAK